MHTFSNYLIVLVIVAKIFVVFSEITLNESNYTLKGLIGTSYSIGHANFISNPADFDTFDEQISPAAGGSLCLAEHNDARRQNGLGPLTYNSKLATAAQGHSDLMSRTGCFSHQCNGEDNVTGRIEQAGYSWSGLGENIAMGQTSCQDVMSDWMSSPGHRANILGQYKDLGCSLASCSSCGGGNGYYWTCDFGSPQ
ncbi:uncharacterized protein LOC110855430 [Folsomia candida]|uniref:uncharacterized protein LOC110855430 n=1 Tax=Folsomia candida TaxID=158441 RepID=UPI000B908F99|nr:uncharacterized protein LOC110855430 [Folsomia candida]